MANTHLVTVGLSELLVKRAEASSPVHPARKALEPEIFERGVRELEASTRKSAKGKSQADLAALIDALAAEHPALDFTDVRKLFVI